MFVDGGVFVASLVDRAWHRMVRQPPAGRTAMAMIKRNDAAENSKLTNVTPETRPKFIPLAARIPEPFKISEQDQMMHANILLHLPLFNYRLHLAGRNLTGLELLLYV